MNSLSNIVKFGNVVEDMVYSLHYSSNDDPRRPKCSTFDSMEKKENSYIIEVEKEAENTLKAAKYEALKIIPQARQQAMLIKTAVQEEAVKAFEEAKREGYDQGFYEGENEIHKEGKQILEEAGQFLEKLYNKRNDMIRQNMDVIKELSLSIAKKVIDSQLNQDDEVFISLFKKAAQECTFGEWVKISVSSCEYEFVTSNKETLLSMVKGAKYIDVVKLDHCPKGTCIVETPSGIIDASVGTQLARIRETFDKADQSSVSNESYGDIA